MLFAVEAMDGLVWAWHGGERGARNLERLCRRRRVGTVYVSVREKAVRQSSQFRHEREQKK